MTGATIKKRASGSARTTATATATAACYGRPTATAAPALQPVQTAVAVAQPPAWTAAMTGQINGAWAAAGKQPSGDGSRRQEAGLLHYLQVSPTDAQEFVWMVPVAGVDYTVTTSTNLKWNIT